jgi:hypothetical protein
MKIKLSFCPVLSFTANPHADIVVWQPQKSLLSRGMPFKSAEGGPLQHYRSGNPTGHVKGT